jgi:hypothetical protein
MSSDFMYNASALGLGGVIDNADGTRTIISSLASVALAPTGGEGCAIVENYSHCSGISFSRAESRVVGYETADEQHTTYTDIFVTGLSVFERFKVALMQVTMTSTHNATDTDSSFDLRAMYRGVEVDGEEIIPAIDFELCSASTYDDFANKMLRNRPEVARQFAVKETELTEALVQRRAPFVGSIVSSLYSRKDSLVRGNGNKVFVPGIGTARFGEFLVKPGRRRINLLRFTFGNPEMHEQPMNGRAMLLSDTTLAGGGGSLTVGSGDGNGVPIWPHG